MTVQVEAETANDIRAKLGYQRSIWLQIDPITPGDYGREPKTGFTVRWQGWEESFTRKVSSVAELLEVLRPIVMEQEKRTKAAIKEMERKQAADHAAAIKAAKKEVARLEAQRG